PDKTYVSKSLAAFGPSGRRVRIASKVFDTTLGGEHYSYAVEKGEVVLRVTSGKRQEVIAKFFEDDRQIFVLTMERYKDGAPYGKTNFSFIGPEIERLLEFILNIKKLHLPDDGKINITDEELRKIILSGDQAKRLAED